MTSFAPYKILHIELSQGIPTLIPEAKYQGIYTVFWWYGIPLGHVEISTFKLPMTALSLYSLIVQTITPAVGNRLLDHGFKASLPIISKNPSQDTPVDFHALMALHQPLKQLQEKRSSTFLEIIGCLAGVKFYIDNKNAPAWRSLPSTPNYNPSTEETKLKV